MEFNFNNLTIDEANLIGEALRALPYERVFALINKLQAQVTEQSKPRLIDDEPAKGA